MAKSTPGGVLVLYGPKAVGKSTIAAMLARHSDVAHVDPDLVVTTLSGQGVHPDPETGWLTPVHLAVHQEMERHPRVAVEATGAWASDWKLADQLDADDVRVVRVWVTASLATTLARLASRRSDRVPYPEDEVRRIYAAATHRSLTQRFDAIVDTETGDLEHAVAAVQGTLDRPS